MTKEVALRVTLMGAIPCVVGFIIIIWQSGRSFSRRNYAGVEEFTSFPRALLTFLFEKIAVIIANILFYIGSFMLIAAGFCWIAFYLGH